MFIVYDELELFEFFENNPVTIGEYEAGNLIYTYQKNNFKIIFLISTYEMYVETSIVYHDSIIYSQKHSSVSEIKKIDAHNLKVLVNKERTIIIKKQPQIGVIVE